MFVVRLLLLSCQPNLTFRDLKKVEDDDIPTDQAFKTTTTVSTKSRNMSAFSCMQPSAFGNSGPGFTTHPFEADAETDVDPNADTIAHFKNKPYGKAEYGTKVLGQSRIGMPIVAVVGDVIPSSFLNGVIGKDLTATAHAEFSIAWPPTFPVGGHPAEVIELRAALSLDAAAVEAGDGGGAAASVGCGGGADAARFAAAAGCCSRLLAVRGDVVVGDESVNLNRGGLASVRLRLHSDSPGVTSCILAGDQGIPTLESFQDAAPLMGLPQAAREEAHRLLWRMMHEALPYNHSVLPYDADAFRSPVDLLPPKLQAALSWAWSHHFRPFAHDFSFLLDCMPYSTSAATAATCTAGGGGYGDESAALAALRAAAAASRSGSGIADAYDADVAAGADGSLYDIAMPGSACSSPAPLRPTAVSAVANVCPAASVLPYDIRDDADAAADGALDGEEGLVHVTAVASASVALAVPPPLPPAFGCPSRGSLLAAILLTFLTAALAVLAAEGGRGGQEAAGVSFVVAAAAAAWCRCRLLMALQLPRLNRGVMLSDFILDGELVCVLAAAMVLTFAVVVTSLRPLLRRRGSNAAGRRTADDQASGNMEALRRRRVLLLALRVAGAVLLGAATWCAAAAAAAAAVVVVANMAAAPPPSTTVTTVSAIVCSATGSVLRVLQLLPPAV
ncbi:hypothetical protein VOLCADRAFT_96686 [Volvox carteri f. nagariensis]|uniref:Uncharacterized protein n=1 Tax=Volvox carteri f. nagariensis TaxID=3068 RepID=D8UAS8_VOLCA|nr:uncharacterized protein VOLCADRAFT_96686 [Volvox carteri f. nagariensis]EFJ43210.1 hypothetical protein VOLCADRAFT_96686 [Volvox carteri f. nagariensis]|eukprot:XP_002955785.1 hypothetical protein VOLCADRAFT_96686 [Volvox carteri f. nagariensis]